MRSGAALILAVHTCWLVALVGAPQDPAPPPQATFRTGVDIIQLDVSVLDKDRRPVRGLTAADFTILEDGQPRPVVAFRAVDVPAASSPAAGWARDVPEDVTANAPPRGRVVAILMALPTAVSTFMDRKRIAAASEVVNHLGPDDLAAVVYLLDSGHSQGFTRDHGRLLKAITDPAGMASNYNSVRTHCLRYDCFVTALRDIVETMRPLAQRKTIVYISRGFAISQDDPGMAVMVGALLREAQRANVVFQAVDPFGLSTRRGIDPSIEGLRTLAESTGGRAVVNDNDPEQLVPAILEESSTYYLVGFESAGRKTRDGFHPIKVVVNHPGVEVRTRTGYYDAPARDRKADAKAPPEGSLDAAVAGFLPKPDVPLVATVAPFAGKDGSAVMVVALGVTAPADDAPGGGAAAPAGPETVDVVARAIDPEGRSFGARRLTLKLVPASGRVRYEVLPRLSAPPGKYEVRLGVQTADGRSGSVYTWAEVPDFARAPLSLSGIVLSAAPGTVSGPRDAFVDILPVVPTARREFAAADRVTAFVRLYQGGTRPLTAVDVATRLVNERAEQVAGGQKRFDAGSFGKERAADYRFVVPTDRLPPGGYLLTVDATSGTSTTRRTSRFQVR